MKKKLILLILFLFLLIPINVNASTDIDIHLFYSKTCPHCKAEKEYLNELEETNDNVKVHLYEITENKDNRALLKEVQDIIEAPSNYVPYTVIGNKQFQGFNNDTKLKIENTVKAYEEGNYIDIVGGIINKTITKDNYQDIIDGKDIEVEDTVDVPILGKIDPKSVSLPLLAIIIGTVDGFNPCAMWVLIFLISMLLNMKNKKRMWTLGMTFLLTSATIYLLFMIAWLNIVVNLTQIKWIQVLISIVALIGAFINFKSYYKEKNKDAGCSVVDEKKRKKIFNRIKKFTTEKSFTLAMIGIIALAISVNLVELACSAGLPLLFTQILALNSLSAYQSTIYILIYIFFFLLDDLIIFMIAMFTLKVTGITTKYTKYTHLVGGLIMLIIGLLMLFKPEWIMFNF